MWVKSCTFKRLLQYLDKHALLGIKQHDNIDSVKISQQQLKYEHRVQKSMCDLKCLQSLTS